MDEIDGNACYAPVRIGEHAVVGAGSTITKPVPDGQLGITRAPQRQLPLAKKK